jgi:hypothetical protein
MSEKDIVDVLRVSKAKPMHQQGITRDVLHQAADEIERLRGRPEPAQLPRRLCKDCRHIELSNDFQEVGARFRYAKCAHPDVADLVAGAGDSYCSVQRGHDLSTTCGKAGRRWEERQTGSNPAGEWVAVVHCRPRPWWKFWG